MSSIDKPPRIAPGFQYLAIHYSLGTPVPRNARGTLSSGGPVSSHPRFTEGNSSIGSITFKGPQLSLGSCAPMFLVTKDEEPLGRLPETDPDRPHGLGRTGVPAPPTSKTEALATWSEIDPIKEPLLCSPCGHPQEYLSFLL